MILSSVVVPLFLTATVWAAKPEVEFELGNLGSIKGVESRTKVYEGAPHSDRPTYVFRNIPYAYPVINEDRFKQSRIKNDTKLTEDESPYDGTRDGPLCQQGDTTPLSINNLIDSTIKDVVKNLLNCDEPGAPEICTKPLQLNILIQALTSIIEQLFELEAGFLSPDKNLADVLHEWLDITPGVSEDCLHLAVSTPTKPDGEYKENLPVMFFIHGGAFAFGTQIRMGGERLQAWEDVVVVSINYRVGPLGFLCLDTDEAAGNMGMLDMVVALEWVRQYIGYFGGDPERITIFGESAGSASIGHLVLSKETNGMFQQGIGQSGSAIASWGFDPNAAYHAENIAKEAGCSDLEVESHDAIVDCLRNMPAENVSIAYKTYSKKQRAEGYDGFGGTTPCKQTKGERKFYSENETPEELLYSGEYEPVPIMFGANSHEGAYVYGVIYNEYLTPNNKTDDEEFFKNEFIHTLMKTLGVTNSYAIEYMIKEAYFEPEQMGNLDLMQPGLIDLFSVFFLKASSYDFMEQNSKHEEDTYWYAFDYRAEQKSVFHLLFPQAAKKAEIKDRGVCHADELIYIFDIELPLLLCDVSEVVTDFTSCLPSEASPEALEDAMDCLISGEIHSKWEHCLMGKDIMIHSFDT